MGSKVRAMIRTLRHARLLTGTLLVLGGLAAAATLDGLDRVRVLEAPVALADVELLDSSGEDFTLTRLRGDVLFVFFGFTNCADICPLTMEQFRKAHVSGELDTEKVTFVLVSVDGERDTPEAMRRFLAGYSEDFIGLTGETADLKKLAKQFRAPFFKGNVAGSPNGNYSVAHSPRVYAVDTTGALRAELYDASIQTVASVANALLQETGTP
jgi:protein SCO1/2